VFIVGGAFGQATDPGLFDFRRAAPAILGLLGLIVALAITIFTGRRSGHRFIGDLKNDRELSLMRLVTYVTQGFLIMAGLFQLFGYLWLEAYQLIFFNCIGIYALWTLSKIHLFLYLILGAFNSFVVAGQFAILGYGSNLAEYDRSYCLNYFFGATAGTIPAIVDDRCGSRGYLNWLRLLGLFCVFLQPLATYLCFLLYNWVHQGGASVSGHQPIPSEPRRSTEVPEHYLTDDNFQPQTQPYQGSETYQNDPSTKEFE